MSNLVHVTLKDPTNSGYVWREFYCPDCLERKLASCTWLKVIRKVNATPKHLSTIYPQLVNEPYCRDCGCLFVWYDLAECRKQNFGVMSEKSNLHEKGGGSAA